MIIKEKINELELVIEEKGGGYQCDIWLANLLIGQTVIYDTADDARVAGLQSALHYHQVAADGIKNMISMAESPKYTWISLKRRNK